jgi:tape measure domain-containing protein
MANSVGSVQIDLEARLAKFESDIGRAARLLEKELARGAAQAERSMQRAAKSITDEVDKISRKFSDLGKQAVGLFAISKLTEYARGLANVADSYSNIQAKVRLAAGEQANLTKAIESVYQVSQRTYNSFESTTALIQRTAGALRSSGQSSAAAFETGVRLAEVFNKALVVSGASATEAASSALQFSQALASGKFQGDEFKAVMENNSRFAKLLADSLGVTTAKLREMSTAGELNIQTMLGVLKRTSALDAEFEKIPLTINRAMTQLSNAWTKFIGEADQASGTSRKIASAIQSIADNIPQLIRILITLGEIAVVVFVAKLAGSAVAAGKALVAFSVQAVAAEAIWRSMTAAATASAVATTRAATAMAALSVAGRSLLAFVGGIPGLLLAASAALVYFATRATEVSTEIERLEDKAAQIEKRTFSLGDAFKYLTTGVEPVEKSLLQMKRATLDAYEAEMRHIEAAEKSGKATAEMGEKYLMAGQWVEVLREEVSELEKAQAKVEFANLKAQLSDFIRLIGGTINAARNWKTTLLESIPKDSGLEKEAEQLEKHAAKVGKTSEEYYKAAKAKDIDTEAAKHNAKVGSEAYEIIVQAMDKRYARVIAAAKADDAATAALKANRQELKDKAKDERDAATAADAYQAAMGKLADASDRAAGEMGPLAKAEADHTRRLRDIAEAGGKAIEASKKLDNAKEAEAAAHAAVDKAVREENKAYDKSVEAAKKALDITGKFNKELSERVMLAGMSAKDASVYETVKQYREELEKLGPEAIRAGSSIEEMTAEMKSSAEAAYEAEESARFWRNTWDEGISSISRAFGQFASGQIKSGKDLGRALKDIFRNTWADIVARFAESGIKEMLGKLAKFFMDMWSGQSSGGGGGGGFWGSIFSAAAAAFGFSGGSGGASLSQNYANGGIDLSAQPTGGFQYNSGGGSWVQAVTGGGGYGGSSGGNTLTNYAGNYVLNQGGQYLAQGAAGQWVAANSGTIGTVGAIGGAIAGAYYGSQQGDGGIGTVGSTAAGAIAGYYAGTVAASAFLGASAGAATGVAGAATTGAVSGAAGAASAIPIVGWIAALALIVDGVTGGAIFGSKYRPNELTETVNFGADGVSAKAILNEWKYVSQGSQFLGRIWSGGALLPSDWKDMDFRNREIPVDPELLKALIKVFEGLEKTADAAAKKLDTTAVAILDSSFETKTFYDRKGKVERTETVGTILGVEYKEDWEQFQKRMHAEILIATLAQLDDQASKIAEAYRKNADELMDAAQTMVQAQADLQDGRGLLGGGDDLTSLMAWIEKNRQGDEELVATYARLSQATAQYYDILDKVAEGMKQLSYAGDPMGELKKALDQIRENMDANIEALNAAAEAAGIAGAKEEDLARIRELAAAQIDKLTDDFYQSIRDQTTQLTFSDTPMANLERSLGAIYDQMELNIEQANLLAQAAGHQAASEAQLLSIRSLANAQVRELSEDFWANIQTQIDGLSSVSTPAGDFALTMRQIGQNLRDNEVMASMLARAQGRQGASAAELGRLYDLAARQMQAAINRLRDIGRQQAISLGYIMSDQQIDSRIQELEGIEQQAIEASRSVNGFGDAMGAAAQAATDAINLLLGELSPLNDQQKLQVALTGLYAGNATAEQVLEIGRRLYASSQAYTDLFNQVMAVRPRGGSGFGGGGGGSATETRRLTAEEEIELANLRERQDERNRQIRLQEATDFANTVAALAAAQGVSFEDIAAQIGFNLEDLATDLNLTQTELLDYLSNIDVNQVPDSITTNTDRLLQAMSLYWGDGSLWREANGRGPRGPSQTGRTGDRLIDTLDPNRTITAFNVDPNRRGDTDALIGIIVTERRNIEEASARDTGAIVTATNRVADRVNVLIQQTREGAGIDQPRGTRYTGQVPGRRPVRI